MHEYKIVDVLYLNRNQKIDDASRGKIGLVGTFRFIPISNYDKYRALFCTKKYIKFITSYVEERNGAELLTENSIYVLEDYWADET